MVFPALCYQPKINKLIFLVYFYNPGGRRQPCGFVNGLTRPFSRPGFYYLSESADYSALSTACT
ncbi:hypothetical protein CRX48_22150 [Morganella morganii]|nr:hypothetical protein CRX48_22150 [Morganella morganii]